MPAEHAPAAPGSVTLGADAWAIALPADWLATAPGPDRGQLYVESADGAKGMYVSSWDASASRFDTPLKLAESFKENSLATLRNMPDLEWQLIEERAEHDAQGATIYLDSLAAASAYRIAGKIMVRGHTVIRATFHDYDCQDYAASRAYFAPIIASLRFNEPPARA